MPLSLIYKLVYSDDLLLYIDTVMFGIFRFMKHLTNLMHICEDEDNIKSGLAWMKTILIKCSCYFI